MEPVDLNTERLLLRVPTHRDVDRIAAICADPAIAEYTTVPSPYGRGDAEGFLRHVVVPGWRDASDLTWSIRPADDPRRLLGMVGLNLIRGGSGEVGFWLAPDARGHRYVDEAVAEVVRFGFARDGMALQRIVWRAYVGNTRSAGVARRAGFRFEGTTRLGAVQRGRRRDDWSAALLPTDAQEPAAGWPPETFGPAER